MYQDFPSRDRLQSHSKIPIIMCRLIIMLLLTVFCSTLLAEQTTRKRLKVKPSNIEIVTTECDTIAPDTTKIKVTGYDKPLTSRRESFFVTNLYSRTIKAVTVTFNYYDLSGRQLHSATNTIECAIPAGETRLLHIPSWDKQLSFYYYLSPRPRRQSTPFIVTHSVDNILLYKGNCKE